MSSWSSSSTTTQRRCRRRSLFASCCALAAFALAFAPAPASAVSSLGLSERNYAIVTQTVLFERVTPLSQEEFGAAARAYCNAMTPQLCATAVVLRTAQYNALPNITTSAYSTGKHIGYGDGTFALLSPPDDIAANTAAAAAANSEGGDVKLTGDEAAAALAIAAKAEAAAAAVRAAVAAGELTKTGYKLSDLLTTRWDAPVMRLTSLFRNTRNVNNNNNNYQQQSSGSGSGSDSDDESVVSALKLQTRPLATTAMTFGKYLTVNFAVFPPDGPSPWQVATRVSYIQTWINVNIALLYGVPSVNQTATPAVGYYPKHCSNGVTDDNETDVDCGGSELVGCVRCVGGQKCIEGTDCESLSCTSGVCDAAAKVIILASSAPALAVSSVALVSTLVVAAMALWAGF